MLLTIHNLPPHMRYADIKSLITSKCGFKEVILDNLVAEGRGKKVTIGLAEEEDAAMLVRQINGLYLEGRQLYVVDVRKKKDSEQPFRQTHNYESPAMDNQKSNNQQSNYTPQMDYQNQMNYYQAQYMNQMPAVQMDSYGNQPLANADPAVPAVVPYMGMNMGAMCYMPQGQNSFMDYTGQTQQYPSSATQYPQVSGQYGHAESGTNYQNPKKDAWSRKRKELIDESNESSDNARGNESAYNFENRQQSAWDRGNNDSLTRRSRSPNNRDRPAKRARNEDYDRDSSRKTSNTNRNSQRYSPDRNKAYSGKTIGGSNQNKSYYNNDPVTASSSNNWQPHLGNPALNQNQWNARTNTSAFQQQNRDGFSDKNSTFENKPQGNIWDNKATSSSDSQSNYRKHLEQKVAQGQSKSDWKNPAQTSWGTQNSASQESRSQYSWRKSDVGKNDTKMIARDSQKGAPVGDNPKVWERSSFDKPKPVNNAPRDSNYLPPGSRPKKQRKRKPGVMPLIKQDSAERYAAAGKIASEIEKANPDIIKKEYMKQLRISVRSRLEVLLAERLGESVPQMVAIYRAKFPKTQDRAFCELVVKEVPVVKATVNLTGPNVKPEKQSPQAPKNQLAKPAQPNPPKGQPNAAKVQPNAAKGQPNAAKSHPNANQPGNSQSTPGQLVLPRLQMPDPSGKLPKYPNADKQIYKEQKMLKRLEHQNEDLYSLPQPLQGALDEELKTISDIFKSVVGKADCEQEQGLCDRFLSVGLEQVRKVIKLNVAKRLLNITTNLIIRVMVSGKPPKKQDVELFLRRQNIVSMKKSGKKAIVYIATCNNFATYDRLLELKSMPLNNETVLRFKPFQLVGPKLSYRERTEMRARRLRGVGGTNTNFAEDIHDNLGSNDIDTVEMDNNETGNNDSETGEMENDEIANEEDDSDSHVELDGHDDQHDNCVIFGEEAVEKVDLNDEDFEDY